MEGVVTRLGAGYSLSLFCKRFSSLSETCGTVFKWRIFLTTDLKSGFINEYSTGFMIEPKARVKGERRVMHLGSNCGFPSAWTKVVQIIGNQLKTNITAITPNTLATFASEDTLLVLKSALAHPFTEWTSSFSCFTILQTWRKIRK